MDLEETYSAWRLISRRKVKNTVFLSPHDQRLFTQLTLFSTALSVLELCSWIVQWMPHTFAHFIDVITIASYCIIFTGFISCHLEIESRNLQLDSAMPY